MNLKKKKNLIAVALNENKTLSEVAHHWTKEGFNFLKKSKPKIRKLNFKTVNMGKPKINLNQRKNWINLIYDRS